VVVEFVADEDAVEDWVLVCEVVAVAVGCAHNGCKCA